MADVPYCPLLSIGKDISVPCQEELCMLYVKQLKLCAITVMGYTNAINIQTPSGGAQPAAKKESGSSKPGSGGGAGNPFALDDLE